MHALAPRYFFRPTACAAADPRDWVEQGGKDEDALKAAIALSQLATHPISECVVGLRDALPRGSLLPHVSDFQLRPGTTSLSLPKTYLRSWPSMVMRLWLSMQQQPCPPLILCCGGAVPTAIHIDSHAGIMPPPACSPMSKPDHPQLCSPRAGRLLRGHTTSCCRGGLQGAVQAVTTSTGPQFWCLRFRPPCAGL